MSEVGGHLPAESSPPWCSRHHGCCSSNLKEPARDAWAGMSLEEREAASALWQWPEAEVAWDGKLGKRNRAQASKQAGGWAQHDRAKVRVSVDGLLLLSGRRTRGKLGKGDVAGQKFRRRERLRLQKEAEMFTPFPVVCKGKRSAGRRARSSFEQAAGQLQTSDGADSDASDPSYCPFKAIEDTHGAAHPTPLPRIKRHPASTNHLEGYSSASSLTEQQNLASDLTPGPMSGSQAFKTSGFERQASPEPQPASKCWPAANPAETTEHLSQALPHTASPDGAVGATICQKQMGSWRSPPASRQHVTAGPKRQRTSSQRMGCAQAIAACASTRSNAAASQPMQDPQQRLLQLQGAHVPTGTPSAAASVPNASPTLHYHQPKTTQQLLQKLSVPAVPLPAVVEQGPKTANADVCTYTNAGTRPQKPPRKRASLSVLRARGQQLLRRSETTASPDTSIPAGNEPDAANMINTTHSHAPGVGSGPRIGVQSSVELSPAPEAQGLTQQSGEQGPECFSTDGHTPRANEEPGESRCQPMIMLARRKGRFSRLLLATAPPVPHQRSAMPCLQEKRKLRRHSNQAASIFSQCPVSQPLERHPSSHLSTHYDTAPPCSSRQPTRILDPLSAAVASQSDVGTDSPCSMPQPCPTFLAPAAGSGESMAFRAANPSCSIATQGSTIHRLRVNDANAANAGLSAARSISWSWRHPQIMTSPDCVLNLDSECCV
ncbi:hypothetical protein WJX74_004138 [Apatococcus lobatus]|uniref:Uncharacterized protein n=1 Tax=Apatococcus lobatus TaxID=904363 RepID=A0AAW1RD27_9CHLO